MESWRERVGNGGVGWFEAMNHIFVGSSSRSFLLLPRLDKSLD